MWRRLRRRTFAPRRPVVFSEQWGLLLVSVLGLGAGLWLVVSRVVLV